MSNVFHTFTVRIMSCGIFTLLAISAVSALPSPAQAEDPFCETGKKSCNYPNTCVLPFACCLATCTGPCGGPGCAGPNCCVGTILNANRSCLTNNPPCVQLAEVTATFQVEIRGNPRAPEVTLEAVSLPPEVTLENDQTTIDIEFSSSQSYVLKFQAPPGYTWEDLLIFEQGAGVLSGKVATPQTQNGHVMFTENGVVLGFRSMNDENDEILIIRNINQNSSEAPVIIVMRMRLRNTQGVRFSIPKDPQIKNLKGS